MIAVKRQNQTFAIELIDSVPHIFSDLSLYDSLYGDYCGYVKQDIKDETAWTTEQDMALNYYYLYQIMLNHNFKHILVRNVFIHWFAIPKDIRGDNTLRHIAENIEAIKQYIEINIYEKINKESWAL